MNGSNTWFYVEGTCDYLGEYSYRMESVTDEIFNLLTEKVTLFAETAKATLGWLCFFDMNRIKWAAVEDSSVLPKGE